MIDRPATAAPAREPTIVTAFASMLVGIALLIAVAHISTWILHLNFMRGMASMLATTTVQKEPPPAPPTQPTTTQTHPVDWLSPANWTPTPQDAEAEQQQRQRIARAQEQVAVVEVTVVAWRTLERAIGVLMIMTGAAAIRLVGRRPFLAAVSASLALLAVVLTMIGLYVIIAHGGFEPLPVSYYIGVAAVGSAYSIFTYAYLILRR